MMENFAHGEIDLCQDEIIGAKSDSEMTFLCLRDDISDRRSSIVDRPSSESVGMNARRNCDSTYFSREVLAGWGCRSRGIASAIGSLRFELLDPRLSIESRPTATWIGNEVL